MRGRIFLAVLVAFILILPARGQEPADPQSGPVELEPDVEENVVSVPIDDETGTVNWEEYLTLPAGGGATFGFITALYPPDPAALADCPEILLDSAWYPPIPFSFGYSPPTEGRVATRGWWCLEDASGLLARRDTEITAAGYTWLSSTWFLGGDHVFHLEEGWNEGYFSQGSYLPNEWSDKGIDYFLRSVWFRGILGGQRMENLLTQCGAQRIGRDYIHGGRDRLAIFQVPPSEIDRQNGRGSLLVWLTMGHWRLVRTRLHAAYATEMTEYRNLGVEVENDPQVFFSDFLPPDIYWSIDQYLLTHGTPFWDLPSEDLVFSSDSYVSNGDTIDGVTVMSSEEGESTEEEEGDEQESSEDPVE